MRGKILRPVFGDGSVLCFSFVPVSRKQPDRFVNVRAVVRVGDTVSQPMAALLQYD